jgi:hypothetical protein
MKYRLSNPAFMDTVADPPARAAPDREDAGCAGSCARESFFPLSSQAKKQIIAADRA